MKKDKDKHVSFFISLAKNSFIIIILIVIIEAIRKCWTTVARDTFCVG